MDLCYNNLFVASLAQESFFLLTSSLKPMDCSRIFCSITGDKHKTFKPLEYRQLKRFPCNVFLQGCFILTAKQNTFSILCTC